MREVGIVALRALLIIVASMRRCVGASVRRWWSFVSFMRGGDTVFHAQPAMLGHP